MITIYVQVIDGVTGIDNYGKLTLANGLGLEHALLAIAGVHNNEVIWAYRHDEVLTKGIKSVQCTRHTGTIKDTSKVVNVTIIDETLV